MAYKASCLHLECDLHHEAGKINFVTVNTRLVSEPELGEVKKLARRHKIGRASCRERVCQYV